jgi:H+/gluconate symporter-like permease
VLNLVFTSLIAAQYGARHEVALAGMAQPLVTQVPSVAAIWAVLGALLAGILTVLAFAYGRVARRFAEGSKAAVGGALLASMNTAAGVRLRRGDRGLAGLPGDPRGAAGDPDPLVNEAISVTVLAGVTGSASGGMSIALAAMADQFIAGAAGRRHPARSAAPGGLHGERGHGHAAAQRGGDHAARRHRAHPPAVLRDIFAITLTKTAAVFVVITVYYLTGIT